MLAAIWRTASDRMTEPRREKKGRWMRKLFICVIVAVGLFAAEAAAADDQSPRLNGVWNVTVAVRNCDTGELIRKVRALNLFVRDGSLAETSSNIMRGPSVGTWRHVQDDTFASM